MSVTDKIDKILGEAVVPSQQGIRTALGKGLKGIDDIVFQVGLSLWHYFDLKIIKGPGYIFQSDPKNKTLADELWHRTSKGVEDSEYVDEDGIKKLKKNFYDLVNKWGKIYSWNKEKKGWEFTG